MQRRRARPILAVATAMLTASVLAAACTSGGSGGVGHGAVLGPALTGTINGGGSTFQLTFQQHAIASFRSVEPGITIDYDGGGSGEGRAELAAGVVDFAGSDTAPIPASEVASFKGRTVLYFPVVIGPITVAYNLPGIATLRLSAPVIAAIFQGDITNWSDPAIAGDNPGVRLPDSAITIVRRDDSSGTTQNFSQFLVDAAPQVWKLGSGSMISWPARSRAGAGNAGVASIVKTTRGAVGYVDYADAKADGLSVASIRNRAGRYVVPSATSASAAASQVTVHSDLTFSAVWAAGVSSYPITFQSWILVYQRQQTANDRKLLLAWLGYLLGDGQTLLLGLNYAPLPSSIDLLAARQLSKIVS